MPGGRRPREATTVGLSGHRLKAPATRAGMGHTRTGIPAEQVAGIVGGAVLSGQKLITTPRKPSRPGPGWYELPSGSGSVKAMYISSVRLRPESWTSPDHDPVWKR
jgi:hypothetical protein